MKGTPIFEEVFVNLIRQPGIWLKLLIGGLLSFIPVVNIFALGYLFRFSRKVRRTGDIQLPEWTDWKAMFFDGLRFLVVWIAYWMLPLFLVSLLSSLLFSLEVGMFAYLVFSAAFLVLPVLFASALYRFQMRSDFRDLLDINLIFKMAYLEFPKFLIPSIVFVGMFALLLPIYGVAIFAGFLTIIAFTTLSYRRLEYSESVSF
jgi:hypothetical protein